ncbi:MAG: flavocytochrome c [Thermodesulfobacteriota bacterium]
MTHWHETTDVAVIGSGAAGLSAAVEAGEAGASVIVFEKMKVTGGNTRLADGALAGAGNYLQRERGIADSPDLFCKDLRKAGLGLNHPRLVRILAEQAADAIAWTRTRLGVRYLDRLDRFGGHSVPRSVTIRNFSGLALVRALTGAATEAGAEIRTRCLLAGFHTDPAGHVIGVRIRSGYNFPDNGSGELRNIQVRRGIVLATGGFGNDVSFRMLQDPRLNHRVSSTNHRGATAEGLCAALKIHAAPVHLSWIQTGPWSCADEAGYGMGSRFAAYGVFIAGMLVNPATGRRIVNEWADRKARSEAIFNTGHPCVGITDTRGADQESESLAHCLKYGKIRTFDTLPELGRAYEMPSDELENTIEAYNRIIERGGRDEFGKDLSQSAEPLNRPPFYGIRLWPKVHYTPGGICIDEHARVINLEAAPIPGLFAAGEVCGGIHGAGRLGSCALPECIVFGRIAGRSAARFGN